MASSNCLLACFRRQEKVADEAESDPVDACKATQANAAQRAEPPALWSDPAACSLAENDELADAQ